MSTTETGIRLYFAQHGLAVDKSENPERPLSEEGIKQTEAIAARLCNAGIVVDHIFHSGKLRAAQTAEIFASVLDTSSIDKIDYISANDDVEKIAHALSLNDALYVGHLPHLEKLVPYLITGNSKPKIVKLQNSAVVCLEKDNNNFFVKWYLTVDLLTAS